MHERFISLGQQVILIYMIVSCMIMPIAVEALGRSTVLVTGSTDGIGLTTAKSMAANGYDVIIHGRDQKRIEQSSATVRKWAEHHSSKDCRVFPLPPADLSTISGCRSMVRDVQRLCQKEPDLRLTVLMNNAGVYAEDLVVTADGLELTFAVNVMAPFVITSLLLPTLLKESKSRIVVASSISQCQSIRHWDDLHYKRRPFSSHGSYSESKLFDAMLTMEMADRLQKDANLGPDRITCNCLDPGTVNTKMLLAGWGRCGIDVEEALDETWLCSSEEVADVTSRYFVSRLDRRASSTAYDPTERAKMWSVLTELAPDAASIWNFD